MIDRGTINGKLIKKQLLSTGVSILRFYTTCPFKTIMGKHDNTITQLNNYKRSYQGKLTFVNQFHLKVEASSGPVLLL